LGDEATEGNLEFLLIDSSQSTLQTAISTFAAKENESGRRYPKALKEDGPFNRKVRWRLFLSHY